MSSTSKPRTAATARAPGTARQPWLGVEVRHLAALSAVARTGSFRAAADELGYVQSAISQQIAYLEQLLGVRLIERTRGIKGVTMSEAGAVVLAHADEILVRLRLARVDLDSLAEQGSRRLRVGFRRGYAAGLLPALLSELACSAPSVRLEATDAVDDNGLIAALEGGELDAAFVQLPQPSSALEAEALLTDGHVLLAAADARISRVERPAIEDVAALPLVTHGAFPDVEAHLRARGVEPHVAFRSDATATVEAMVAAGLGVAIVPVLALGPRCDGIVRIDADHLVPPRALGLCGRRAQRASAAHTALRAASTRLARASSPRPLALAV